MGIAIYFSGKFNLEVYHTHPKNGNYHFFTSIIGSNFETVVFRPMCLVFYGFRNVLPIKPMDAAGIIFL